MKKSIVILSSILLMSSAVAETKSTTENVLLDATYKLVKDVSILKPEVKKLKEEVTQLKRDIKALHLENKILKDEIKKIKETLQIKNTILEKEKIGSKKIILATFKIKDRADIFLKEFEEKFRKSGVVKQTKCKTLGICYVVYTLGNKEFLEKIRKKIPDAFFVKE